MACDNYNYGIILPLLPGDGLAMQLVEHGRYTHAAKMQHWDLGAALHCYGSMAGQVVVVRNSECQMLVTTLSACWDHLGSCTESMLKAGAKKRKQAISSSQKNWMTPRFLHCQVYY